MLLSGSPTGALSGSLPETVDVCVVGGGQSALALAFHLRRAERRRTGTPLTVVLLDARAAPGGAEPSTSSHDSATEPPSGMVRPSTPTVE